MTTYINPWHKPGRPEYGPARYETDAKPTLYRGYEIYDRVHGPVGRGVWDIVRDGVCVSQFAGLRGAMDAVDAKVEGEAIQ